MRSTQPSSRLGLWVGLLLALGVLPGVLHAQAVEELPPPGEAAPADPLKFDLNLLDPPTSGVSPGKSSGEDKAPRVSVTWSPLAGSPGTAVVAIRVQLQDGANTYDFLPIPGSKPTKINLDEIEGVSPLDPSFVADRAPELIDNPLENGPKLHEFLHEVTFLRRYRIDAEPAPFVTGKLEIQVCRKQCVIHRPDLSAEWSTEPYTGAMPAAWTTAGAVNSPTKGGGPSSDTASTGIEVEPTEQMSTGYALLLAFLGGILMNFMPCVLPVIAIKVLSFVQQAGESRSRIFALNLTYSFGVIVVFLALGTLATFANLVQGQLFQFDGFNVVMACIVFAMGLSLLGVFEFQLPGALGGAGPTQHEGLTGAFFTGILATLLATPCIGPFVGSAVTWSVEQPIPIIYLVWGLLGLGMASPYLLLGAFPSLIHRMPRPGMWMVRFKELSGFLLMATVIFLIAQLSPHVLIPTLVMLLGIALASWMIGNLYDHSTPNRDKWLIRVAALVISFPLMGFGVARHLGPERMANIYAKLSGQPVGTDAAGKPESRELPWEPFSPTKFVELRNAGKPVLIDFTASWCLICKSNEYIALNTQKTAEFVKNHDVVCFQADFSDEGEDIKVWLKKFGASGVPLTVVFPPGEKAIGIKFDAAFTETGLHSRMNEAWQKSGTPDLEQTGKADSTSRRIR